jgi:hypothetical protein
MFSLIFVTEEKSEFNPVISPDALTLIPAFAPNSNCPNANAENIKVKITDIFFLHHKLIT